MNPSICIPKVHHSILKKDVIDIFEKKLKIGDIDRIDIVQKKFNKRVFIHFKKWNSESHEVSDKFLKNILENNIVKVVYDFPWYWKCCNSKIPKPDF